jgi:hypothetical protein
MGFNYALVGFGTVYEMVVASMGSEAAQVEAIVRFAMANKLDATLRRIDAKQRSTSDDWRPFAKGYNGAGYEKNGYHVKLSDRFNWWRNIPDTPWTHEPEPAPVVLTPPEPPMLPMPSEEPGFLARLAAAFFRRMKG